MANLTISSKLGGEYFQYAKEVRNFSILDFPQEQELFRQFREQGDLNAAKQLVQANLRLVLKVSVSFVNYGLSMMDIVSEGTIGLMHAIKKFDYTKGFRLSTYAVWWIKANIQEYILKNWSIVKLSGKQKELFFSKIQRTKKALEQAAEEGSYLENKQDYALRDASLNDRVFSNRGGDNADELTEMMDVIDSKVLNPEEAYINHATESKAERLLVEAISNLNERERLIIETRHLDKEVTTLDYLSRKLAISKERVRQIEIAALSKMRKYMQAKGFEH